MLVNFFSSKNLKNNYKLSFSYRFTKEYEDGLFSRVRPYFKCFPLNLPYLNNFIFFQNWQNSKFINFFLKFFRLLTNFPFLLYEIFVLYRVLSKVNPNILHVNSGGYPPTMSAKAAIIAAHFCGVKKIILVVNNLAEDYSSLSRLMDLPLDKVITCYVDLFITASVAAKKKLRNVLKLNKKKS